jgi:Transcriptional regulator containing an amidase domain and an AraC-type DNA-binding HTH domain
LNNILKLLKNISGINSGVVESRLPGVRIFKETKPIACRPMLYNPGICIIASGHKIGHLAGQSFRYDADNYLVTSVAMPFETETHPDENEPLLGLFIDIDMAQLADLISQMNLQAEVVKVTENDLPLGVGPSVMNEEMREAVAKLLTALQSEMETKILAPGFVREIYYRALCGEQAPVLYSLAKGSNSLSQVARVINKMEVDYHQKLDVEYLADTANMSVSAFHKAFKEITADSPLQYLKKIRLAHARDLMTQQKMKAYLAADKVGYESPSQFSREFKRYFGVNPAELLREMR